MTGDIYKTGLLVIRDGRVLLCRKKHTTSLLILPGGKFEDGESAEACLARELQEECGVGVSGLEYIGRYTDRAAGEEWRSVTVELYCGDLTAEPSPQSEIKELVWFGETDDRAQLSPSLRNKILPDLLARGLLGWG